MQLYCPSCQANIAAVGRCPKCGDRLVTPAEAFVTSTSSQLFSSPPPLIPPSPFARVAVGLVVALGLYIGFRDWSSAVFLLAEPDVIQPWVSVVAIIATRILAVFLGGLLGGAGREQGAATGLIIGVACGGLFVSVDVLGGQSSSSWDAVIGAFLATIGAGAGMLGGRVWPPALESSKWKKVSAGSSLIRMAAEEEAERNAPPTQWWRVVIAAAILIAGVSFADDIRDGMRKIRGGQMNIGNLALAPIFNAQIAGVAIAFAGILAGATTGAGIRHGFIVGILGGLGIVGYIATGLDDSLPTVDGLIRISGLPIENVYSAEAGLMVFAATLGLCTVCGWFGGELMPRIVIDPNRRYLSAGD